MIDHVALQTLITHQRYPVLFATLSGSHLYGFSTDDSDYDVRGAHLLPPESLFSLREPTETIEAMRPVGSKPWTVDLVTHDLRKFVRLLIKKNGNVLEELFSPHVIISSPAHDELKALVPPTISRFIYHHYKGFATNEWKLMLNSPKKRLKHLLYIYRICLAGCWVLRSGTVEANLEILLDAFPEHAAVRTLVEAKRAGAAMAEWRESQVDRFDRIFRQLLESLETAFETSTLPEDIPESAYAALDDFVIRTRTSQSGNNTQPAQQPAGDG